MERTSLPALVLVAMRQGDLMFGVLLTALPLLLVLVAPSALLADAQTPTNPTPISLTASGTPYTQDFDSLAASGTSSSLPSGWAFFESGSGANTSYTAGAGSSGYW